MAEALKVAEAPVQIVVAGVEMETEDVTAALIVISIPLSVPMVAGALPVTRMRYMVPEEVLQGIVALIVPLLAELLKVPMGIAAEKLPDALESSAV